MYLTFSLVLLSLLLRDAVSVIVDTEQGQLRGEKLTVVTGDAEYYSFKGIPYAKPPLGELRFRSPQPPEPWSGVRDAYQHGSACVQLNVYNNIDISGNEDCLYLNVYTPRIDPKNPLPVMFYIHSGGFQSGSSNVDRLGPDYLIVESVIVVTINFRLGALGYLNLYTKEVPGNAGLKDQVAALKWVRKNIANFGGDPNCITIFGQTTGGDSVALHNLSPMTKGLYKRSISMSGVPLNDWAWPFEPRRLAFRLGQQVGISTLDEQELLNYLRSLPAEKLLVTDTSVLRSQTPNVITKQVLFAPTTEIDFGKDSFLTIDPVEALKTGQVHDVDLMIGHVASEGFVFYVLFGDKFLPMFANYTEMFVPMKILENVPPAKILALGDRIRSKYFGKKPIDKNVVKELVDYISDSSFNYGISKYAKLFSKHRKTFLCRFSIVPDFPRSMDLSHNYGIVGPYHEDDVMYLFYPQGSNITIDKNTERYKSIKTVCALYTNFAKKGNPTPDKSLGVEWPAYNESTEYYLNINTTLTVGQRLNGEAVEFWDKIYNTVQMDM